MSSAVATSRGSERRIPTAPSSQSSVSRSEEDEARSSSKYRAALEAMFARKSEPGAVAEPVAAERAAKIVSVPVRDDPRREERDKRLAKLLAAEGHAAVSKACESFLRAGFELPDEQEVCLKLLDHHAEARVKGALEGLSRLLGEQVPQRRAVLEARLRRLEEDADDAEIRALAAAVRAKLPRQAR